MKMRNRKDIKPSVGSSRSSKKVSILRAIPPPDWGQISFPVANVRRCIFLLMNLDPQVALERRVHALGSDHLHSALYEKLLHRSAMQMILGNPLLQPLLGSITGDRDEFQRIVISVDYFIELARSDVSPYRDLLSSLPEGLVKLTIEPPFDKLSGKKILEQKFVKRQRFIRAQAAPNISDEPRPDVNIWSGLQESREKEDAGSFGKIDARLKETLGIVLLVLENWPAESDLIGEIRGNGKLNMMKLASLMLETLNDVVLNRAKEEDIKFFNAQTLRKRLTNALEEAKEFEIAL